MRLLDDGGFFARSSQRGFILSGVISLLVGLHFLSVCGSMAFVLFLKSIFRLREATVQSQIEQNTLSSDDAMGILDHLEDLRRTVIKIAATLLLSMILCFGFAPQFMAVLRGPVDQIWESYESERLPSGVVVQDWIEAKSFSSLSEPLDGADREAFASHFSPEVRALALLVPYLNAAQLLPDDVREDYIKESFVSEEARCAQALSLLQAGAVMREGKGREALKLMGAFQPGEAFMLSLSLSFFGGLILAFPLLMFFLLQFIVPGLHGNERALLYKCIFLGFGLFITGVLFAYFLVLPRVLSFFYDYSLNLGIENDWRIGYYISFATKLVFVFGSIFELPVLVMPFVKLGVLTYDLMKRTRAYALVACFEISLLLAPAPDPGTMLIMAMPMYLLYELCILYAW